MLASFDSFFQDTRLLQLSTPLGPNKLLAECLRAEEGLSQCFELKLTALSTDAAIPLASLLGQPVLLELLTAHSRDVLRPFHGHITAVESLAADGGLARYSLTIGPWYAFLGHGRDSRVFQGMNVFDILDAVFSGWVQAGQLAPAWRFDIEDRSIYPARSLTCQYQESSLAFAERLMKEEGLFYYFEHAGDSNSPGLGSHTMVIADHNGAFTPNAQPDIDFTQPGAVMKHDSIDRWRIVHSQRTNAIRIGSWDYRSLGMRHVSTVSGSGQVSLTSSDAPGAYAYETREQGERIARRQIQALDAAREVHIGAGTVRTLAPGTTFTLHGQAQLDAAGDDDARSFAIVRVVHLAHNNLNAAAQATVARTLGQSALQAAIASEESLSLHAVGAQMGERPLYRNRIDAIRSATPYRSSNVDQHGQLLCPRPTVRGQQSAIVVGPDGAFIHTDRDHRIKVQFHWQRGSMSHSRLSHPLDGHSGAPGNDHAGTWVRLATPMAPVAGANWGSVAIPRVGSEVLIDFIDGDIDRPVVIGSLYNGKGGTDNQSNHVSQGAGVATGNAPAWFPGDSGAHAHPAVLSGFKSQAMSTSQLGDGAYSQLVFDDSAGQSRVALQRHARAHQGTTELNLGQIRHQSDNQRLQGAGFGAELKAEHSAALRAGNGLLVSSHARTDATSTQLDSREAQNQMEQNQSFSIEMATTAQQHNAGLKDADGKAEPKPDELPAHIAGATSIEALAALASGSGAGADGAGGGHGEATAYGEPQLQLSSPFGIVSATPASTMLVAGNTSSIIAGQDINLASQANLFHCVKGGISLFTYGKAASKVKPNQETGIMLHAGTGKVSSQSQDGPTMITADKMVTVASIAKNINVAAKKHVMLTAQGAFMKLEGGNISLHGPGKMEFKASMKELAGPVRVPSLEIANKTHELNLKRDLTLEYIDADGNPLSDEPIVMNFRDEAKSVMLDSEGKVTIKNVRLGPFSASQPRRKTSQ